MVNITQSAAVSRPLVEIRHNRLRKANLPVWFGLLFLIPVLGYWVLPALGVSAFASWFDFKHLLMLFGLLLGGLGYWHYLRLVLPRPQLPVFFVVWAWPMVAFLNADLLSVGINIHLRPLLIATLGLPMAWVIMRQTPLLWGRLPWIKYYALFCVWLAIYLIFYNANAVDPRLKGGEEALSEGSVSVVQFTAYLYCFLSMATTGVAVLRAKNYRLLFDVLNQGLLWVSSAEAILTILGFPLGLFKMELDGFTRAMGIFTHPNTFAHHMGVLMVYFLGLFCYYQGERKDRLPPWLLLGGLGLNGVAFLLGLSKTALAVFALCAGLVLLLNLAVPAVRKSLFWIALGLVVLMPLSLFLFQMLSGQSFFQLLESRLEQTQSLTWRTQVWQDLSAEINLFTIWLGHGFTAANDLVFHLTFNDSKNAQPLMMVHNAYIALLYDLGVMGYLMFVSAFSLISLAVRGWLRAGQYALRTEYTLMLGLTLYFLLVCALDEMSYMFDAPMLFWVLVTALYCVSLRESTELAPVSPSSMGREGAI